jgi:DNA-binding transcriptional MerR regulator
LSAAAVAVQLGVSTASVRLWERGGVRINARQAAGLSRLYGAKVAGTTPRNQLLAAREPRGYSLAAPEKAVDVAGETRHQAVARGSAERAAASADRRDRMTPTLAELLEL